MIQYTTSLFDNHAKFQQQIQNDIAITREQLTQLRELINAGEEYETLAAHHNRVEELKVVRQRVQTVLHFFTVNVSILLELNNDVNGLIEQYNVKTSSLVHQRNTSRRQSHDSTSSNELDAPKKIENLLEFEDDVFTQGGSPTKSTVPSPNGNNSPNLNPKIFQSPASPPDSIDFPSRIISPLIDERTEQPSRKLSSTSMVLKPTDFFDDVVQVEDELNDQNGTVYTVNDAISTTTVIGGDDTDDAVTDDATESVIPTTRYRTTDDEFESPRQEKVSLSTSSTELDKLLDIFNFGEGSVPLTPSGSIDVDNAINMLTQSPSSSMENINGRDMTRIDDASSSRSSSKNSSTSFELLDELLGSKTNGEIKSGVTTRILSMFEDPPEKEHTTKRTDTTLSNAKPSSSSNLLEV
jgi:hypothetical protein